MVLRNYVTMGIKISTDKTFEFEILRNGNFGTIIYFW